jgi:hypothetical protein
MARTQTMVQLTEELVVQLDREAARRGMSRSALIRELLEEGLHDDREAEIDRKIVDGYTRIPPGAPDDWGDLEALSDRGTRDLLRRLDSEDRAGW